MLSIVEPDERTEGDRRGHPASHPPRASPASEVGSIRAAAAAATHWPLASGEQGGPRSTTWSLQTRRSARRSPPEKRCRAAKRTVVPDVINPDLDLVEPAV